MNENLSVRIRWSPESLRRYSLRPETAAFLSEVGLPESIPGMTLEFGIYDSDSADVVIGEDYGLPVSIDSVSDAVFVADSSLTGRCFINSSVQMLDRFIQAIVYARPSSAVGWAERLRRELAPLDSAAFESTHCMWPAIIERFQLNLT